MALVTSNRRISAPQRKKVEEIDDTSEDSDSTDSSGSVRGSIDIDHVYEYSTSSSNSFDPVEDKEENKILTNDTVTDIASPGAKEEQISHALWAIDSRLMTKENYIQSTFCSPASELTGWELSTHILIPKPSSINIENMCNHNSSSIVGVSPQLDFYGNNLRSKNVDRVFRPAGLIDAGADYSITCQDGVDPVTYSYIPHNGCYAMQKAFIRETICAQKMGKKVGIRGPMLNQAEDVKLGIQEEVGNSHNNNLDFTRSKSDYLLKPDPSPRLYSYLENQIHPLPGELMLMKDVSKEYVVIPPVTELASKNKKVQPAPKVIAPAVNQIRQGLVNDNQSAQKQPSDARSIDNAYLDLVRTRKPNSQTERIPESDLYEQEHRHPSSAGGPAVVSRKPLKALDKAERYKSSPVYPVQNPLFLVSPAFIEDFETNCKNDIYSTGLNAKTVNERRTTASRSVTRHNPSPSCYDNLADDSSNNQQDGFDLPQVIGSSANAIKRPLLKPDRRSARDSHKASVMKGKTNSATTTKAGPQSDRTTNQVSSSTSQSIPVVMQFPSIQNHAVVSGTKLNGAFTISRIL